MSTRRRYTKREKTTAVIAAEASSIAAAAQQTGIPESNIRYWLADPKFAVYRDKSAEDRAEQFRVVAQMALARLIELIPTMDAKDLVVLMGVATDKSQLLAGKATDRVENVSITDGLDDHEKDLLKQAVLGELGRRADARTPVPAVGDTAKDGADTPTG